MTEDGLSVLFGLLSQYGANKDDEIEELALQTVANLAINGTPYSSSSFPSFILLSAPFKPISFIYFILIISCG